MSRRRRAPRRAASGGYQAGPGTVVSVAYALYDAEGELVERSAPDAPLVLLLGYGAAAPALEQALGGLCAGEEREIFLDPADAFGERDPHAVIEVDRADLPADLVQGDELAAEREDGRGAVALKVLEILEDVVVLDTNHPLSGQRVNLKLAVQAVRPASPEELDGAAGRLQESREPAGGPLLPVERLLRRGGGDRPQAEDPTPPASGRLA